MQNGELKNILLDDGVKTLNEVNRFKNYGAIAVQDTNLQV
jgi:hypothetical protein